MKSGEVPKTLSHCIIPTTRHLMGVKCIKKVYTHCDIFFQNIIVNLFVYFAKISITYIKNKDCYEKIIKMFFNYGDFSFNYCLPI